MFSRFGRGVLAAVAATAVLAGAGAVVYSAAPNPVAGGPAGAGLCSGQASTARAAATVADLRAFGACEIGRRITTLGQLSSVVAAAKGLTSSDAATLSGYIGASRSGLTRLKATLDADTRLPAVRADILRIVAGYRVYVLLGPQVRLTIAADTELALKPHFDQMAATLAGRISAGGQGRRHGTGGAGRHECRGWRRRGAGCACAGPAAEPDRCQVRRGRCGAGHQKCAYRADPGQERLQERSPGRPQRAGRAQVGPPDPSESKRGRGPAARSLNECARFRRPRPVGCGVT